MHDALHEGTWILDLRGRVSTAILPDFVNLRARAAAISLTPGQADGFRWRNASGIFSTSDAYRRHFLGMPLCPLRFAWKAWATPRCRFFVWVLLQRRLATADRLQRHGIPNNYFCAPAREA